MSPAEEIARALDGIDRTEDETCQPGDSVGGWWETSAGAAFGAARLAEVQAIVARLVDPPDEHPCLIKAWHNRHEWTPIVVDPDDDHVLHVPGTTLTCPGWRP